MTTSPPRKILVGVDFSEHSNRAFDHACALAAALGAEVHALHVCPLLAYALKDEHPDARDFEQRIHDQVDAGLAALRERGDVTVSTHRIDGSPGPDLAAWAEKNGMDLVVVGTHGRSGVDRVLLGSVAERIVRLSPVPVLTVP